MEHLSFRCGRVLLGGKLPRIRAKHSELLYNRIKIESGMRYSLHEIDKHHVVATTVAVDRDEALELFSEKLRLMLTFEGDPVAADYLLDEWPEGLLAHTPKPTIPVFIVSAIAAPPQASQGAGCGQTGA
jgi:hypothetical protein